MAGSPLIIPVMQALHAADEQQPGAQNDTARMRQRSKQVQIGKLTLGYQNYLEQVPKDRRVPGRHQDTPSTSPRSNRVLSKRAFEVVLRNWRQFLHTYDDANVGANRNPNLAGSPYPDLERNGYPYSSNARSDSKEHEHPYPIKFRPDSKQDGHSYSGNMRPESKEREYPYCSEARSTSNYYNFPFSGKSRSDSMQDGDSYFGNACPVSKEREHLSSCNVRPDLENEYSLLRPDSKQEGITHPDLREHEFPDSGNARSDAGHHEFSLSENSYSTQQHVDGSFAFSSAGCWKWRDADNAFSDSKQQQSPDDPCDAYVRAVSRKSRDAEILARELATLDSGRTLKSSQW
ncbi:hypothetical protein DIPPA_64017 [Diplonema papillatum]|nr:hypothetical protein DIPPA_64017 [Diplonema papillatum]